MRFIDKFKKGVKTPQGFFLAVTLLFGGLMIFLIPPLQTPDEPVHFISAYKVSVLNFAQENQNGVTGNKLPTAIDETVKAVNGANEVKFNPNAKYDIRQIKHALTVDNTNNTKIYLPSQSSNYPAIAYLPQAVGITLGRIFDSPVIILMYLARLATLLTWATLGFLAIKIIPIKKWAFVAVALLPMMVAQSASAGTDVISIGAGLVFIALVLRSIFESKITRKYAVLLTIAAIIMVSGKLIMAALLPLVLLLMYKKVQPKKLVLITTLVTLTFPFIVYGIFSAIYAGYAQAAPVNGESPSTQLQLLITHPWQIFVVLFNTYFFNWGDVVVQSLIGNFGWVDTPLASTFVMLGYVLLAFVLFTSYEKSKKVILPKAVKVVFLVTAILYALAVSAAMYIYYSPPEYLIVVGVQGRYLIPVLFLLVVGLYTQAIKTSEKVFIYVVKYSTVGLLTVSVITIYLRYYVQYF